MLSGYIFRGTLILTAFAALAAGQAERGTAKATLRDAKGREVGTVVLTDTPRGVLVRVDAKGLPPGERAFHIHERGVCTPPDFTSAGGHYNPAKKHHGFHSPGGHHAGDMANLVVAADGTARAEVFVEGVKVAGSGETLLSGDGTAVVIHAGPDDYRTDPAGDAGGRIACGVIQKQ
jgi:Cu-Zn family superoxide dismutase